MTRCVIEFKNYPQEYDLVDAKKLFQYKNAKVSESEYTLMHVKNISLYAKSNIHVFENSEIWKNVRMPTRNVYTSTKNMENRIAFNKFKAEHIDDPEFKGRFVAFVNGEFQGVGNKKETLVESMYDRFGNVPMYVSVISSRKRVVRLRTPRFTQIEV